MHFPRAHVWMTRGTPSCLVRAPDTGGGARKCLEWFSAASLMVCNAFGGCFVADETTIAHKGVITVQELRASESSLPDTATQHRAKN